MPFLSASLDRVRLRAYFHWLNRTGKEWWNSSANWLQAEEEELLEQAQAGLLTARDPDVDSTLAQLSFFDFYDSVGGPFVFDRDREQRPVFVGSRRPRRCSLCRQTTPTVTFRNVAHLIPESLGNKWLKTYDECDACNEGFGGSADGQLASMLLSQRAVGRVASKKGTAKLALDHGRASVGGQPRGAGLQIETREGDPSVTIEFETAHEAKLEVPTAAFRPLGAIKAVARMAWHILDASRQSHHESLRKWLTDEIAVEAALLYGFFIPGPGLSKIGIAVWENVKEPRLPALIAMVFTGNTVLVWPSPRFEGKSTGAVLLPPLPLSPYPPHVPSSYKVTAKTNELIRLGRPSYGIFVGGSAVLKFTRDLVDAFVQAGAIRLGTTVQTPGANPSGTDPSVTYLLTGGDLVGEIRLNVADDVAETHLSWDASTADEDPARVARTLDLLAELCRGSGFIIEDARQPRRLISARATRDEERAAALSESARLAHAIALVAKELTMPLTYPADPTLFDADAVLNMASAMTHGQVRHFGPITVPVMLRLDDLRALSALVNIGAKAIDLPGQSHFTIGDQSRHLGAVTATFLEPQFAAPDAIQALLTSTNPPETMTIEISCAQLVQRYDRWAKRRTGLESSS